MERPLSSMPVSGLTSQWPLCSSTGERGSIFRTRSPQSLFLMFLLPVVWGHPSPLYLRQWSLHSGRSAPEQGSRYSSSGRGPSLSLLPLCLSLSLSLSLFLSVSLSLPLLLSSQDGKTPLDYARERNHTACICLLESHMGPSRMLSSFPSQDLSPEEKPSVCRPLSLPTSSLQSS
jgi:hypothetical protein